MSESLSRDPPATNRAQLYDILVSELTDLAVFLTDPAGRATSWNPGVERLLGYAESEWIGQPLQLIFTLEDRAAGKPEQEMARARQEGRSPDVRWHERKNGTRLFVEGTLVGLKDSEGRLLGYSKVMRDVTARHLAEEAQKKSQEQLTFALEATGGVGTWDWDVAGDHLCADLDFARLFSLDPEQAAHGAPVAEFLKAIHPDDAPEVLAKVKRAVETGEEYAAEYRLVQKDGPVRWVNARGRCHRDENGQPTHFPGVAFETTERKKAEAALRDSEEFARSIFESSPDCVKVLDMSGYVLSMNTGGCQQLEIDDFSLCAYRPWLDLWPEAGRAEAARAVVAAQRGETARFQGFCPTAKGSPRWWEVIVTPIRDSAGQPVRLLVVSRDISERKRAEQELTRKAEELASSNADLQQFGFMTSHDLQEPLRTMISFSQLLMKRYKGTLDQDAAEFLGFIVSGAYRMKSLVDSLLAYTLVVDRRGSAFLPVALPDVVEGAAMNLQSAIQESQARITYDELPLVMADQAQMVQLLQNLVSNAIKYRQPESPPRIHLSAEKRDHEWTVAVHDNGIGIRPEHQERIFGAFERLHGREIPGTGIGLAICRRIVEKHGGRIWATSQPGRGSIFYFTLPADTTLPPA